MLRAIFFRNKTTPLDAAVLFQGPEEVQLQHQGVQSRNKAAVPVGNSAPEAQPRLRPGIYDMNYITESSLHY